MLVVWSVRVDKPSAGTKALVEIPPLKTIFGHTVAIRLIHANGRVDE